MYTEFDGFSVKKIVNGGLQNNSYIVKNVEELADTIRKAYCKKW